MFWHSDVVVPAASVLLLPTRILRPAPARRGVASARFDVPALARRRCRQGNGRGPASVVVDTVGVTVGIALDTGALASGRSKLGSGQYALAS